MFAPVFIRGHIKIKLGDHTLEFLNQRISLYGISGLHWNPFSPSQDFGKRADVKLTLLVKPTPKFFNIQAIILRESSLQTEYMGLKFMMDEATRAQIHELIQKNGFYPTEYLRKYPRIPATPSIQTFPLHVQAAPILDHAVVESQSIIYRVGNLSPNGILLSTENQMSLSIMPGTRLHMHIDPRGWFPTPVEVEGTVCRVLDEVDPTTGNMVRHLGCKFTRVDDLNRNTFQELLKDILERIKALQSGAA